MSSDSGSAFVVTDRTSGNIGSSRYYDWDSEKKEVAIGYTLAQRSMRSSAIFGVAATS